MIYKIIVRLNFIKKLPKNFAKKILLFLITFDELFWKIRMLFFILFLGKKSKIGKALSDLKENGIAIIPNFYQIEKVKKIKENCIQQLDYLPIEKLKGDQHIHNLSVNEHLFVEKLKGQIKLKGLQKVNFFFQKIGTDIKSKIIILAYHCSLSRPLLIYNLVHDGSFRHPAFSEASGDSMIAGKPHVDLFVHQLRIALALDDINEENGPTVYYKKSMNLDHIKENHSNLILEQFGFRGTEGGGHFVNSEKVKLIQKNKFQVIAKQGDLILMDLKSVHHQTPLKKGQRHILWYYY